MRSSRWVSLAVASTALLSAATAAILIGVNVVGADTSISITFGGCPGSGGGTEYCFNPESASATTGQKVTWTGTTHTATLCTAAACPGAPASSATCDNFNVSISGSGTYTFAHPGTCYYYCMVHGYAAMHAMISVASAATPAPATATPAPATSAPAPSTGGATSPGAPATSSAPAPTASAVATAAPTAAASPSPGPAIGATGAASGTSGGFPVLVPIALIAVAVTGAAAFLVLRRSHTR